MPDRRVTITAVLSDKASRGLQTIGKGFKSFGKDVDKLNQKLGGLTGKVAGLAASIGGGALAQKSLALAEKEFDARTKVLAAMEGNVIAAERVFEITDAIQAETRVGNEELNEAAAILLLADKNLGSIEKRLQALVGAIEATPAVMQQTVLAMTEFDKGTAGLLTRYIPQLKVLRDEGRLAAEGVDFLRDNYYQFAIALAKTPFGQAVQQSNLLGDQLERIGKTLIGIKLGAVTAIADAAEDAAEALESAEVEITLSLIQRSIPHFSALSKIVGGLVALILSIKLVLFLKSVLAISAVIAVKIAAWVALIAVVAVLLERGLTVLLRLTGLLGEGESLWGKILKIADDMFGRVGEIVDLIQEGKLEVEDLFDYVTTRIEQAGLLVLGMLHAILIAIVAGLASIFTGDFENALDNAMKEGKRILFSYLEDVGEKSEALDDRLAASIERNSRKLADEAAKRIANLVAQYDKAVEGFADPDRRFSLATMVSTVGFEDLSEEWARELFKALPEAGEGRGLVLGDIKAQVDEGKVALQDFFAFRRELTLGALADERVATLGGMEGANADLAQLEERRGLLEAQVDTYDRMIDRARAVYASGSEILELETQREGAAQRLLDVSQQEKAARDSLAAAAEKYRDLTIDTAVAAKALTDAEKVDIAELFQVAEDARSKLAEVRAEIADRAGAGLIIPAEARVLEQQAMEEFASTVDRVGRALGALTDSAPEFTAYIEELLVALRKMKAETKSVEQTVGRFLGGFRDGLKGVITRFNDMRDVGLAVGEHIANSLSEFFGSFFDENRKEFKEWIAELLRGLANLMVQMAAMRTLSMLLGVGAGGGLGSDIGGKGMGGLAGMAGGGVPGGQVPGPRVRKDIIPALLMPREYVQPVASVDYYGVQVMEAMRRRLIPRGLFAGVPGVGSIRVGRGSFAEGGAAVSTGSMMDERRMTGIVPALVADEDTMERLIAAAERPIMSLLGRNAGELQALIDKRGDRRR